MALKTLRCCGDSSSPGQRSTLRVTNTLNPPKKYICKLRRLSSIYLMSWHRAQGLMWGARGQFLPWWPWLWRLWRQLCFVLRLLKKEIKTLKLVGGYQKSLFITIYCKIYCNSYITNCSVARAQVVVWPEPEPHWSNWPQHIGYRQKALVIVRMINTLCWRLNVGFR